MSNRADLIIEIGTEELPPKSLPTLGKAFAAEFESALKAKKLDYQEAKAFYTPRRLAVLVRGLIKAQADIEQIRKGPAVAAALDAEGNPTRALEGFARSCKVKVSELSTQKTDKGEWYCFCQQIQGQPTEDLLFAVLKTALDKLPIAKRMRWGSRSEDFVRPVHWILAVFDGEVLPITMFEITAANISYGHRFHHPQAVEITDPLQYESKLEAANVLTDFNKRKNLIKQQIITQAEKLNARASIDEELLDEVTSLVEYPRALTGSFDKEFLAVPPEAIIAFMQDHQKFFALMDKDNKLLPNFITVSNIDSKDINLVREGNERVIRPRLTDALFFWQQDLKQGLEKMGQGLGAVVYQDKLGSVQDKTDRVAELADFLAGKIGADEAKAVRAASLAKADLLSGMVGEFPKLQGIMGHYYALAAGEDEEVAKALTEQYLPKFAKDQLPASATGQVLALAERIDTLLGIFGIGLEPTGEKDPFALRRSAIGVLRIISEGRLRFDLGEVLEKSAEIYGALIQDTTVSKVEEFILERFKRLRVELGGRADVFDAVKAVAPLKVLDFIKRESALDEFLLTEAAASLAAANKRIANILKKSGLKDPGPADSTEFIEAEETALNTAFSNSKGEVKAAVDAGDYAKALNVLAGLREPIDAYFDKVMVMCEDEKLRHNRLAFLSELRGIFLQIADISKISV